MINWHTGSSDPIKFTIAADARFCSPDYANDHIWSLNIGQGEPPSLAIQTTYGLRARSMRLFPRFIHKEIQLSDPLQFHRPPVVRAFYPNYLLLTCSPFPGLDLQAEYWAAASQVLAGRLTLTNTSVLPDRLRFEWVCLLNPMAGGQSMAVERVETATVLQGSTGNLCPVVCMTGGADAGVGPYPALVYDLELMPGNVRQFTWAAAALDSPQSSFALAQRTLQRPWDAELTRMELLNEGQSLEVQTGEPDWDLAFALAQKVAFGLFFPGGDDLPNPSFVISRQPDHGNSIRGDGSDYPYLWSGQTPLDALYLSGVLGPGGAPLMRGIVENFLAVQAENGFIDMKPGLGGQRSRRLAQPVLATLVHHLALTGAADEWLAAVYPPLLRFVQAWFSPEHDRDSDGFPEWDHPVQTGLEDAPIYDRYLAGAQGAAVSTMESPALAAMLYRECASLLKIARRIGADEGVDWLQAQLHTLKDAVESSWDSKSSSYRYRDFETHKCLPEMQVFSFDQPGEFAHKQSLKGARRLQVRIQGSSEVSTRPTSVTIYGAGLKGALSETIPPARFFWQGFQGKATTTHAFKSVRRIEVSGLAPGDRGTLSSVDYTLEDLSLLLPLWAEIPTAKRAKAAVEKNLIKRYLQPFGLSVTPLDAQSGPSGVDSLALPWNHLLVEALLAYGYRKEAAVVVTRILAATTSALKEVGAFRAAYSAVDGAPRGEWNAVSGLAPLGLFLRVAGIRQIGRNEVILDGINPFPWPVTVKYQGMTITCHSQDVVVSFSTGHSITVSGSGPQRVSLSSLEGVENSQKGEQINE